MPVRRGWTRQQLLVAYGLYCRLPFGRLHHRNPEIVQVAEAIGRTPSALAMKLGNIAHIDPAIASTGRAGLRNASAKDRALWEEMHDDWGRFAVESHKAMREARAMMTTKGAAAEEDEQERRGEDRSAQTTARIGQNFFRAAVLSAYDERCCITGLSVPSLLVASHIVPWKRCDSRDRVNPRNGLLLSSLHDKAFDAGLLAIDDALRVRVSPRIAVAADPFFSLAIKNYDGRPIALPEKFAPEEKFLAYHREHVFQA